MKSIYNNKVIDNKDLLVSPLSQGFSFGNGFFTTIKVKNRVPENLELHLKRIRDSLDYFSFNIGDTNIEKQISNILELNNLSDARVKITFFQDVDSASYIISCSKLVLDRENIRITISDNIRGNNELYKYKSLNYYTNLKSFYTIFKDHKGRVLETGFANIFILKSDAIYTPPISLPILPGTYRQMLLNKGKILGLEVKEKELYLEDLTSCNEIFLTNSIRGVMPVNMINNIKLSTKTSEEIKSLFDTVAD